MLLERVGGEQAAEVVVLLEEVDRLLLVLGQRDPVGDRRILEQRAREHIRLLGVAPATQMEYRAVRERGTGEDREDQRAVALAMGRAIARPVLPRCACTLRAASNCGANFFASASWSSSGGSASRPSGITSAYDARPCLLCNASSRIRVNVVLLLLRPVADP